MNTLDFAHDIINTLEEKKGEDIILLDLHDVSLLADYFVICSGTSPRMIDALSVAVSTEIKQKHGLRPRKEGSTHGGWILVDYGDVILHIFSPDRREYYDLEDLWSDARVVLHLQ